jgi:copper chaperone CopZ
MAVAKQKRNDAMTTLKITGMTCDSCAAHVKEALEKVPGVQSALVSYPKAQRNSPSRPARRRMR